MSNVLDSNWPNPAEIKSLSCTAQVKFLFQLTQVRYPAVELPPESIAAYKADWAELLKGCGTQRFLVALQRSIQSTTFFPLVADIAKHIPPPPVISTIWQPTEEDRRRKAAGERSYGVPDVKFLGARLMPRLDSKKRAGDHGRLTDDEVDGLLAELNVAIDQQEGRTA